MKTSILAISLVYCVLLTGCNEKQQNNSLRVGTYDSRSIAVAFAGTDIFKKNMKTHIDTMTEAYNKAKAQGNTAEMKEIEKEMQEEQDSLHKLAFSTAPVDDILANYKDKLEGLKKEKNLDLLISKWDQEKLRQYHSAQIVDVTVDMIDVINPDSKQRESAIEIQKHKPISLEQAENIKN